MANPAVQNLLISKNKYYPMALGMGYCGNGSCHKVLVSISSVILAKDVVLLPVLDVKQLCSCYHQQKY